MGTKRKVKVILMGAGASTLNFLKKAEEEMEELDMTCYEKNHDIGGTWLENRYPGCACDIPSVNYQFSWKIKLWSHYYSYAPEIWEYLKSIERENDLIQKYIKLQHQIEHAQWDDEAGLWRLKVRNLVTDEVFDDSAEFFINAGGVLNNWKWPDIPGLKSFKGKLMHSAHYEEGYDLTNKRVAVIGAGSSGVQIVASIQRKVDHLYHWVRSPIWITAGFAQTWAGKNGANFRCRYINTANAPQLTHNRQRRATEIPPRQPKEIPRVPQTDRKRAEPALQIHHEGQRSSPRSTRVRRHRNAQETQRQPSSSRKDDPKELQPGLSSPHARARLPRSPSRRQHHDLHRPHRLNHLNRLHRPRRYTSRRGRHHLRNGLQHLLAPTLPLHRPRQRPPRRLGQRRRRDLVPQRGHTAVP